MCHQIQPVDWLGNQDCHRVVLEMSRNVRFLLFASNWNFIVRTTGCCKIKYANLDSPKIPGLVESKSDMSVYWRSSFKYLWRFIFGTWISNWAGPSSGDEQMSIFSSSSSLSGIHFRKLPRSSYSIIRLTWPTGHSETQWKSHGFDSGSDWAHDSPKPSHRAPILFPHVSGVRHSW